VLLSHQNNDVDCDDNGDYFNIDDAAAPDAE